MVVSGGVRKSLNRTAANKLGQSMVVAVGSMDLFCGMEY